jgi:arylsulfatase A-like enzyme
LKHALILSLLALSTALHAADRAPTKPNVLYLVADDLGFADLGVQGCTDVPTPNLDSLAKNGVRFTNSYVSAPVCSPSRAGLITGRYQTCFGHEFNPSPGPVPPGLPGGVKTAGDWFKEAGYTTAHIGKWHIGDAIRGPSAPNSRGFDDSVLSPGQNKIQPLIAFRNGKRETPDDSYVDLAMGREAATFIEKHQAKPWFLFVAYLTPHAPTDVPSEAEKRFAKITDVKRRKNAAMISLLDESVGRILKALRDTGQEERTLIVFHSDHGAPFNSGSYNTPLRGYKSTLLEGGIRAPILMQWKGKLPAGRVDDAPVISLDVLPTALAAAEVSVPADAQLDGANLLPYLAGKSDPPKRNLFWRYGDQYAIRQGNWKLVHSMEKVTRPPEITTGLYDLTKDVGEAHDLSAEHPEKVKELQRLWDEWNSHNVRPLWGGDNSSEESKVDASRPTKKN